ncbi:hypothetical protein [Pseudorhodoferax soli]|uniref:Uncharacterized protein n=1 Tax=Pseudorhodoferax soli TaxID=545864 RepID=A0A368XF24_9BURK|nr:hypothetical protein [Pseudorhodoferax soli]RCW66249.1 hypothetical protein DES41_111207 [Pseudorhodoferax soli]
MIETEKLKKQREARLAAEALFEPIAQPPQTAAATVVTVRHRRASTNAAEHVATASPDALTAAAGRPARIHLVAAEPAATTTDTAAVTEPKVIPLDAAPLEAKSTDVQPVEAPAGIAEPTVLANEPATAPAADQVSVPVPPKPRKTRRRATAPVALKPQPVEKSVTSRVAIASRSTSPRRQELNTKAPHDHAPSVQHLPATVGFEAYEWPVYPKLIAQIEELKRKAQVVREHESAQALEWIKGAIRQYGLSAQDLGFGQGKR